MFFGTFFRKDLQYLFESNNNIKLAWLTPTSQVSNVHEIFTKTNKSQTYMNWWTA